jgi:heterodisulfide reductase subunit A-like polyferredoxin
VLVQVDREALARRPPPHEDQLDRHSTERIARSLAMILDLLIVGAGFSGLYMLHKARTMGLSALVVEAAPGVGGTWCANRYPGA